MKVVTYRITLLEPTLVTEMSRDPNSDVAAPYLPGSALRGAIIGKYIQRERGANPQYEFKADGTNERKLFFDSQTRYLNGYLFLKDTRSLPTPRSWHQEKAEAALQTGEHHAEIYDLAAGVNVALEQPQGIGKPFFLPFSNGSLIVPRRCLAVHTARTRRFGRAVSPNNTSFDKNKGDTVGAVYRYDSLASDQTFAAAILCENDADATTLAALLKGVNENKEETLLGGSRNGGYGLARFHHIDVVSSNAWHEYKSVPDTTDERDDDNEEADYNDEDDNDFGLASSSDTSDGIDGAFTDDDTVEQGEPTNEATGEIKTASLSADSFSPIKTKREITITFLSDVLLRDANGQSVVDVEAVRQAISEKLPGVVLTSVKEKVFMRGRAIGGFNRKWGLPLPQTLAVQMGSVFVFAADNLDEKALILLAWQGIGERRAEGFGRIAVDWHNRSSFIPDAPPQEIEIRQTLEGISKSTAQNMAARLLRKKLDNHLIAKASGITIHKPPHSSQLARLRNVIHAQLMSNTPSLLAVELYLKDIERRTTARKQFEGALHGSDSLISWLEKHLKFDEGETIRKFEELLELRGTGYMPKVGGEEAQLTTDLCREYMLRFIDAVLARVAKDKRKENEN